MSKTKKYKYKIHKAAEGETVGYVELTPEEAAIVDKALDVRNWSMLKREPYSGDCWIDIDNPVDVNELIGDRKDYTWKW